MPSTINFQIINEAEIDAVEMIMTWVDAESGNEEWKSEGESHVQAHFNPNRWF
jgi:hypothetical protein